MTLVRGRQRDAETETDKERQRETETHKERDRHRHGERQRCTLRKLSAYFLAYPEGLPKRPQEKGPTISKSLTLTLSAPLPIMSGTILCRRTGGELNFHSLGGVEDWVWVQKRFLLFDSFPCYLCYIMS